MVNRYLTTGEPALERLRSDPALMFLVALAALLFVLPALAAAGFRNLKGVTLAGCAHWVFEENPAETVSAVMDFLAGTEGARQ